MNTRLTHSPVLLAVARKFPGYTAENLDTKGIHEVYAYALALRPNTTHAYASVPQVAARRFCLVAADHPLVSAISENAEK